MHVSVCVCVCFGVFVSVFVSVLWLPEYFSRAIKVWATTLPWPELWPDSGGAPLLRPLFQHLAAVYEWNKSKITALRSSAGYNWQRVALICNGSRMILLPGSVHKMK